MEKNPVQSKNGIRFLVLVLARYLAACKKLYQRGHGLDSEILKALVDENKEIGSRITAYHTLGVRMLTVATTILLGAAGLAAANGFWYALLGLPFGLCVIAAYLVYINTEVIALGAYKRALEEQLNDTAGVRISGWESRMVDHRHMDMPSIIVRCLFLVALVSSSALAVALSTQFLEPGYRWHAEFWWVFVVTVMSIVLGLTGVGIGVFAEFSTRRRLYPLAVEFFKT